jgi:hypothetical protein
MTQYIRYALSLSAAFSTAAVLSAQTPPQPQTPPRPQAPTTQPITPAPKPDTPPAAETVTASGCLKAEKDVPGLKPNVAERAGMGEDYILTNVRMLPASSGSKAPSAAAASKGVMYKIEGLNDDELKKHLNHQVELTGRIVESTGAGKPGGAPAPGGGAAPSETLKAFQATSLKMVSATCPAQTNEPR